MPHPVVSTLEFFRDFKCENCTLCCRSEWRIPLLKEDFETLSAFLAEKFGPEKIDECLERVEGDPNVVATFRRKPDNACVFLSEESGLCTLHRDFGERVLPAVCKTYPRMRVAVGEHQNYALSVTCPTARRLLTAEGRIRVVDRADFDLSVYSGLRKKEPERTLTLKHRLLSCEAYHALKTALVERFNRSEVGVDAAVAGIAGVLAAVDGEIGRSPWSLEEMRSWLSDRGEREWQAAAAWVATRTNPQSYLTLMGSWLNHRSKAGPVKEPLMADLIAKFAPQAVIPQEAEAFAVQYRARVEPVLQAEHWIARNYLASKLFLDPLAITLDYLPQGFLSVYFAWGLLKLALTEKSLVKPELNRTDVLDAAELVEHNTSHAGSAEEGISRVMADNRVSPAQFLSVIRF